MFKSKVNDLNEMVNRDIYDLETDGSDEVGDGELGGDDGEGVVFGNGENEDEPWERNKKNTRLHVLFQIMHFILFIH